MSTKIVGLDGTPMTTEKTFMEEVQEKFLKREVTPGEICGMANAALRIGIALEQELVPLPLHATRIQRMKKEFAAEIMQIIIFEWEQTKQFEKRLEAEQEENCNTHKNKLSTSKECPDNVD